MKKGILYLRILLIFIFIGIIAFSSYKLFGIYVEYKVGTDLYNDLAEQYVSVVTEEVKSGGNVIVQVPDKEYGDVFYEEDESIEVAPLVIDFDVLKKENRDIIAWIYCPDTPVNYPILQSDDNEYYVRRMVNRRYNLAGSLFADCRNSANFSDLNTIVYGHNMKNDAMFAILPKYVEQEYYDAHSAWYLFTPDAYYRIDFIGGYETVADSATYSFPKSMAGRDKLIKMAKEKSFFESNTEVLDSDRLITLSTCSRDYGSARYVLVGVLREIEGH